LEIYNGSYSVYYHQNKTNGKIYIGITRRKPEKRWGTNGIGYKHCTHFYNAIQKYGWNSFEHVIYACGLTREEACNMEKKLISLFHTDDSLFGYNICEGGGLPQPQRGEKNYFFGKHIFSGKNHPMYGKHHTEETRLKMSKNHYDASGGNNPIAKTVICVETGKIYPSAIDAQNDTGIPRNNITAACRKDRQVTAGGYHWNFV